MGPAGAQGMAGVTGAQGSTLIGPAGPVGRTGSAGAQGLAGVAGAQGSTTVGNAGDVGLVGQAGPQGPVGATGAQGSTTDGNAGGVGRVGEAGPQGPVGATGAQGPVGVVKRWTLYRDFQFANNRTDLSSSENDKVLGIARYIQENPSLKIAIDSSKDTARNQDLSDRRCRTIRDALIKAGVASDSIQIGEYGDKALMPNSRIALLVSTTN
jgi:outer membrane protein OmpA-like peptidoglycan-associated protein